MQLIGIHGKSGSGKTTVAAMLAAELLDLGYTVKLDSVIQSLRERAWKEFGHIGKDACRSWLQRSAMNIRMESPRHFINELYDRNNMVPERWMKCPDELQPAHFLIIHDVRMEDEVEFCQKYGVVIHLQGTHKPLYGAEALHETEQCAGGLELFYGADYIIPQQPSLSRLADAVKAMVEAGGHLRKNPGVTAH